MKQLYATYGPSSEAEKEKVGKLAVIAVPTQDFNQELGSNEAVKKFACGDKGAKYNLMGLTHVLIPNGEKLVGGLKDTAAATEATAQNADAVEPLMRFLQHATEKRITWNFNKFVVDTNGVPVAGLGSREPAEPFIRAALGLESNL